MLQGVVLERVKKHMAQAYGKPLGNGRMVST